MAQRESGGDQKLGCRALMQAVYAASLPTQLPAAGAKRAAQMHRALGHLVRCSLSRAGGGSVFLMSILVSKSIPITNWAYFYGEICKIFTFTLRVWENKAERGAI